MEPRSTFGTFSGQDGVPFAGLFVKEHVDRTTTSELLADWERSLERSRLLGSTP